MTTSLQKLAHNASVRAEQVEPAPMHENPALALAMQQLEDAAKKEDEEFKRFRFLGWKKKQGFALGSADAYRRVISVLAQTKV